MTHADHPDDLRATHGSPVAVRIPEVREPLSRRTVPQTLFLLGISFCAWRSRSSPIGRACGHRRPRAGRGSQNHAASAGSRQNGRRAVVGSPRQAGAPRVIGLDLSPCPAHAGTPPHCDESGDFGRSSLASASFSINLLADRVAAHRLRRPRHVALQTVCELAVHAADGVPALGVAAHAA